MINHTKRWHHLRWPTLPHTTKSIKMKFYQFHISMLSLVSLPALLHAKLSFKLCISHLQGHHLQCRVTPDQTYMVVLASWMQPSSKNPASTLPITHFLLAVFTFLQRGTLLISAMIYWDWIYSPTANNQKIRKQCKTNSWKKGNKLSELYHHPGLLTRTNLQIIV